MILRKELPADRAGIRAAHAAAFAGKHGAEPAEVRLVDTLRQDGHTVPALSLVATIGGDVVGHVVCSRATADGGPLIGLGPIGVLPDHQRREIGTALMHGVLAAADALDEPAVVLLGDPAYYRRFGFVLADTVGLLPPDPEWVQHFQVRLLTSWDGSLHGTVRYAPAFDRL